MLFLLGLLALADTTRVRDIVVAPAESVRVVEYGAGSPIVLIPGLFGSSYGFRTISGLLAEQGYRVIVVEPLGIGWSGKPKRADYSLGAQADRVAAVLDTLELESVVLVGHSIGASIALRAAYRRPSRISGVLSLDGGPAETATSAGFRRAMKFAPLIKLFGGAKLMRGKIRGGLVDASGDPAWITDEVIRGYTAGAAGDLGRSLGVFRSMSTAKESEALGPRLPDIVCPVRLVLGGAVHKSGPDALEVEAMRQGIASFAVDTLPGAGHYLHEEQPVPLMEIILRFAHELSAPSYTMDPRIVPTGGQAEVSDESAF
jgi:pimeloyl-ACP methyl ester carboxylesterase